MRSIIHARADFISVLEALYRPEPDTVRWAGDLLVAVGGVVVGAHGQGVTAVAHDERYDNLVGLLGAVSDPSLTHVVELANSRTDGLGTPSGEFFRAAFYPGRPVETHGELASTLTGEVGRWFRGSRQGTGARDMLGLFAYPQPGLPVVLWALFDRDLAPSRVERRMFHRVAGHLDSAFRLRYRPDLAVAAVLSPAGRFLDLEPHRGKPGDSHPAQIRRSLAPRARCRAPAIALHRGRVHRTRAA